MATQRVNSYEFERLPLSAISPGTNILLTGPVCDTTRELFLHLLLGEEGVVIISAGVDGSEIQSEFEGLVDTSDPTRVRFVNCVTDIDDEDEQVIPRDDVSGIGLRYAKQYEDVSARGFKRVRTGIYTLTPIVAESDDVRSAFRFINTVASRVRTAEGLSVCWLDAAAHDERVLTSIRRAFDGRIEVRVVDDCPELRVRGLDDQPREWTRV
jgi:hypothetical protein